MKRWGVSFAMLVLALCISKPSTAENATAALATYGQAQQEGPDKATAGVLEGEDTAAEAALLNSVNHSRSEVNAAPLRMDDTLRQAARIHAERMVANGQLEHQFPGELSLLKRIAAVSALRLDRAGENIADVGCAADAHGLLMNSPPHRHNILDTNFNVAGIAAVWSHGRLYVVQDFAHEVASYSVIETGAMIGKTIQQLRREAGLPNLARMAPPNLDDAACALAEGDHPNSHVIAASYHSPKVITYTQSDPGVLSTEAWRLVTDPNLRYFAVGSCYARNAAYPTGIYWVAILLN